jgi:glycogen debranching enzyme
VRGLLVALAEVQAYVYGAYVARAHLAHEADDQETAHRWWAKATHLKQAFNEAFWLPDRGHYALALDRDKRPVDALASNMGHCLWTGIVDREKAGSVAAHLMSPEMFTGWGVRTLATSMARYNPMSYHNGSVWPHDNALVVQGLMRYGFVEEASRVATALLEAAGSLDGALPELFCGFDRDEYPAPVPYPTSCAPQAWAAATPVHLLRTLLRLDPFLSRRRIWFAPVWPDSYGSLRITNLPLAGGRAEVTVGSDGVHLGDLDQDIEVVPAPRDPLAVPV